MDRYAGVGEPSVSLGLRSAHESTMSSHTRVRILGGRVFWGAHSDWPLELIKKNAVIGTFTSRSTQMQSHAITNHCQVRCEAGAKWNTGEKQPISAKSSMKSQMRLVTVSPKVKNRRVRIVDGGEAKWHPASKRTIVHEFFDTH